MTEFDTRYVELQVRRMQALVIALILMNTTGWLTVLYLCLSEGLT